MLSDWAHAILQPWLGVSTEIQAAVLGAVATVVTATIGALIVICQIGQQARHAINQNRDNEALKLKSEVYREVVAASDQASDAETDLSTFVRLFQSSLEMARLATNAGMAPAVPAARIPTLIEKKAAADRGATALVCFIERWKIIDPRTEVFKVAANVAFHDINEAYGPYLDAAFRMMPYEGPNGVLPWQLADEQTVAQFSALGNNLIDRLSDLQSYTYDFQLELQNLLHGKLFGHTIEPRVPLDPRNIVISLKRHKELIDHFQKNTAWGKRYADIKKELELRELRGR
jgi:hypothetical protein